MIYQVIGCLLLLAFYGVYLGKMLAQRRKGIRTNQMAKGKEKGPTFYTELLLQFATYGIVLVELVCILFNLNSAPPGVRMVGILFALLGVVIFSVSVWTMRDSWRAGISPDEQTAMVTTGIYAWSRNPAFLGFDLLYLGILLLFFHWVLLVCSLFAALMLHLQILQEERFLPSLFGEDYIAYQKQTNRYFGRK